MNVATLEWIDATNGPPEPFVLKLFICGMTHRSERAITATRSICEEHLPGRYALEVVDITKDPARASQNEIVAAPTLIKERPAPLRRLVGDLSRRERVLAGLGIRAEG